METMSYTKAMINLILKAATEAGNKAGDEWMANATPKYEVYDADIMTGQMRGMCRGSMLDLCGNAHVRIKDKRTRFFKALVKFGFIRDDDVPIVPIEHKYHHRQEYGLAGAISRAAMKVLVDDFKINGLGIWEYID